MTNLQKIVINKLLDGHNIAALGSDYRVRDSNQNAVLRISFRTFYLVKKVCRKTKGGLFVIDKRKVRSLHGNSFVKKAYKKPNNNMKLKEFNAKNTFLKDILRPSIGINQSVGVFYFNKSSVRHLDLSAGDQIKVFQDEDEPGKWYLEKVSNNGFPVRTRKHPGMGLMISCKKVVIEIMNSVSYVGSSGKLFLSEAPVMLGDRKLWPLITTQLING